MSEYEVRKQTYRQAVNDCIQIAEGCYLTVYAVEKMARHLREYEASSECTRERGKHDEASAIAP